MEPEKASLFSIQTEIIRLIQAANGQNPCYATPAGGECSKMECVWRSDCLDEARELFPSFQLQNPGVGKSFDIPAGIIKLLQANDGQETDAAKSTNKRSQKID